MITSADISSIDTSYFEIVGVKDYTLTFRSANTGHYWALLERMANGHRTFLISHRHHEKDPYHFQKIRGSADGGINAAIEYIMHHDEDYISRLREKELRRERGRLERLERLGQHESSKCM
jgi:hypothetical protein